MPRSTDGFAPAVKLPTRERRPACDRPPERLRGAIRSLSSEVKFQAELKLPRIKCRGRLAVVMAVAGSLSERIYHLVKGVGRGFVEAIEEIESFSDYVQTQPLSEVYLTSEPRVKREIAVRDSHVATQRAVGRKDALQTTDINASSAQLAVGLHAWAFVRALKIAVGITDGENVERTTRLKLDNRRQRKTSQERFEPTRGSPIIRRRKHATEYEAMSLVE